MESLLNRMSRMNFDSEMKITEDMLTDVIHIMKKQRLSSLTVDELVGYLSALQTGNASTKTSTFSTPNKTSNDFDEPSFTFKSPELKFPFKMESNPNPNIPVPEEKTSKASGKNGETKLPGFFEAARQSIPSSMDTPDKFTEYGLQGEESTQPSPRQGSTDKIPTMDETKKALFPENTQSSAKDPSSGDQSKGAWFWGKGVSSNTADQKEIDPTFPSLLKNGETCPMFHVGSGPEDKKKKDKSVPNAASPSATATASSLFTNLKSTLKSTKAKEETTFSKVNEFTFPSIPQATDDTTTETSASTSEATQQAKTFDSTFKVHTMGAKDILHSLNDDNQSPRPESAFTDSYSNGAEEMSVDDDEENVSPFVIPTTSDAEDTSSKTTENKSEDAKKTTASSEPTKAGFHFEGKQKPLSEAFRGLQLDEDTISFNLGTASTTGPKSSKKSSTKRNQSAKKAPKATTEVPTGPQEKDDKSSSSSSGTSTNKEFAAGIGFEFNPGSFTPHHSSRPTTAAGAAKNPESSNDTKDEPDKIDESKENRPQPVEPMEQRTPRKRASSARKSRQSIPNPELEAEDQPPSWWKTNSEDPETQEETGDTNSNSNHREYDEAPPTISTPRRSQVGGKYRTMSRSGSRSQDSTDTNQSDKSLFNLAEEYSRQGKELYANGQYDRALEAYDTCLRFAPKGWLPRATILGNRAAVNFMLGRYIECVNDCDDALMMDTSLIKLLIRKGKSLIKLGHISPAEGAFNRILNTSSSQWVAQQGLDGSLLEAVKLEAKAGIRELEKLNKVIDQVIQQESKMEWNDVIKTADTVLKVSPHHRMTQITKANALLQVSKYQECKDYIEKCTFQSFMTIAALYAHKAAVFPLPATLKSQLDWKPSSNASAGHNQTIDYHPTTIVNFFLCIGNELGVLYLNCLKNLSINRLASAEMMNHLRSILQEIEKLLSIQDKEEFGWIWVTKELSKLSELISLKTSADQLFKTKNFHHALVNYTNALKIDKEAKVWNAILFSNRAATEMSLGLYAEAVNDCHNAIAKDPEYSRAYLRRARAYRAMNKFNDSVRDYRRYLSFDPIPSDFKDIQKELDEMIDLKAKEEKDYQQRQKAYQQSHPNPRPQSARYSNHTNNSNHSSSSTSQQQKAYNRRSTGGMKDAFGNDFDPFSTFGAADFDEEGFDTGDLKSKHYYYQYQQQQKSRSNPNTSKSSSHKTHYHNNTYSNAYDKYFNYSDEEEDSSDPPPTSSRSNNNTKSSQQQQQQQQQSKGLFSLKETDHYTILGVDTVATDREIKMAYRKLALQFHPDKNKDEGSEDRFKMISLAYSVLSDKALRREYDLTRPIQYYTSNRPSSSNYGKRK